MISRFRLTLVAAILIALSGLLAAGPDGSAALAAATVATCAPDSGSATLGGTVTGPGGAPLDNVQVSAFTSYGVRAGADFTDASGAYEITDLIGGSYLIEFAPQSDEHQAEWYPNQENPFAATAVSVAEGGAVAGIDAELAVGARFSGTVTGQGGAPLAGIAVSVYAADDRQVAAGSTDAGGNYTTSPGLPTGSYRVGFGGASGFLGSFYNNAASLEAATPLAVTAPTLRSGIDAALAPGGTIRGTVTSAASGLPLSGIQVSASGQGGNALGSTDVNGNYTLTGLGSGRYSVSAASLGGANLAPSTREVEVTAPDATTGVNFALAAGATLSGKVTGPGGAPLDGVTVYVSSQDDSFQDAFSTDATGAYTASGLPAGIYRALFRADSYIPEAYNNQPDSGRADLIAVPAQGTVNGIDAELASGATVRGRVTDAATGLPIDDIFVELLDLDGKRVETALTQADGSYATPATLASGEYLVRFNADERFASCSYVTAFYGGQLRIEDAMRITVSAPTAASGIDAQLSRGSILFGRVTDEATGTPITNGRVTVLDAQNRSVGFGRLTFLGGWHTETALPSGSYRLRFEDENSGYIDEYYTNALRFEDASPVLVSAPTDISGLDAALAQGAAIAGRVTAGDSGAPFNAGNVRVYSLDGAEVGYGEIEEDGSYRVRTGLASGSYYVAVSPYVADDERTTLPAQGGAVNGPPYTISYHGGRVTRAGAERVAVTAPQLRGGVDIVVLQASWLSLVRR